MLYTILPANEDGICQNLPDHVRQRVFAGQGFLAEAVNELHEVEGIAVFSFSGLHTWEVDLEYIMVLEECRERGVASGLLNYVSRMLKELGVKTIACRLSADGETLSSLHDYLTVENFVLMEHTGHLIEYSLQQILACKALIPLLNRPDSHVKRADDIDKQKLRSFCNGLTKRYIGFSGTNFDERLSRFYVRHSEISGCMLVKVTEEEHVKMFLEYTDKRAENQMMLPKLLMGCAAACAGAYAITTGFVMELHNEALYEALCKVLGKPEQDFVIQQYLKLL